MLTKSAIERLINDYSYVDQMPDCVEKCLIKIYVHYLLLTNNQNDVPGHLSDNELNETKELLKVRLNIEDLNSNLKIKELLTFLDEKTTKETQVFNAVKEALEDIKPLNVSLAVRLKSETHELPAAKDVRTLVLGPTGSGKSTLLHFLAGATMVPKKTGGVSHIDYNYVDNPAIAQATSLITTSAAHRSETRDAHVVNLTFQNHNISFCDTPGLRDTGGLEQQIVNATTVTHALNSAPNRIVLVLDEAAIRVDRGTGLIEMLRVLVKMMPANKKDLSSISYVFTRINKDSLASFKEQLQSLAHDYAREHSHEVLNVYDILQHIVQHVNEPHFIDYTSSKSELNAQRVQLMSDILSKPVTDTAQTPYHLVIEKHCLDALKLQLLRYKHAIPRAISEDDVELMQFMLKELESLKNVFANTFPDVYVTYDKNYDLVNKYIETITARAKTLIDKVDKKEFTLEEYDQLYKNMNFLFRMQSFQFTDFMHKLVDKQNQMLKSIETSTSPDEIFMLNSRVDELSKLANISSQFAGENPALLSNVQSATNIIKQKLIQWYSEAQIAINESHLAKALQLIYDLQALDGKLGLKIKLDKILDLKDKCTASINSTINVAFSALLTEKFVSDVDLSVNNALELISTLMNLDVALLQNFGIDSSKYVSIQESLHEGIANYFLSLQTQMDQVLLLSSAEQLLQLSLLENMFVQMISLRRHEPIVQNTEEIFARQCEYLVYTLKNKYQAAVEDVEKILKLNFNVYHTQASSVYQSLHDSLTMVEKIQTIVTAHHLQAGKDNDQYANLCAYIASQVDDMHNVKNSNKADYRKLYIMEQIAKASPAISQNFLPIQKEYIQNFKDQITEVKTEISVVIDAENFNKRNVPENLVNKYKTAISEFERLYLGLDTISSFDGKQKIINEILTNFRELNVLLREVFNSAKENESIYDRLILCKFYAGLAKSLSQLDDLYYHDNQFSKLTDEIECKITEDRKTLQIDVIDAYNISDDQLSLRIITTDKLPHSIRSVFHLNELGFAAPLNNINHVGFKSPTLNIKKIQDSNTTQILQGLRRLCDLFDGIYIKYIDGITQLIKADLLTIVDLIPFCEKEAALIHIDKIRSFFVNLPSDIVSVVEDRLAAVEVGVKSKPELKIVANALTLQKSYRELRFNEFITIKKEMEAARQKLLLVFKTKKYDASVMPASLKDLFDLFSEYHSYYSAVRNCQNLYPNTITSAFAFYQVIDFSLIAQDEMEQYAKTILDPYIFASQRLNENKYNNHEDFRNDLKLFFDFYGFVSNNIKYYNNCATLYYPKFTFTKLEETLKIISNHFVQQDERYQKFLDNLEFTQEFSTILEQRKALDDVLALISKYIQKPLFKFSDMNKLLSEAIVKYRTEIKTPFNKSKQLNGYSIDQYDQFFKRLNKLLTAFKLFSTLQMFCNAKPQSDYDKSIAFSDAIIDPVNDNYTFIYEEVDQISKNAMLLPPLLDCTPEQQHDFNRYCFIIDYAYQNFISNSGLSNLAQRCKDWSKQQLITQLSRLVVPKFNSSDPNLSAHELINFLLKLKAIESRVYYFKDLICTKIDHVLAAYTTQHPEVIPFLMSNLSECQSGDNEQYLSALVNDHQQFITQRVLVRNRLTNQVSVESIFAELKIGGEYTIDALKKLRDALDNHTIKYWELVDKSLDEKQKGENPIPLLLKDINALAVNSSIPYKDRALALLPYLDAVWTMLVSVPGFDTKYLELKAQNKAQPFTQIQKNDYRAYITQPLPIQTLAVLTMLGAHNDQILLEPSSVSKDKNSVALKIGTGEGKSKILATAAAIFGLLRFEVYLSCYSKQLSDRDFEDFKKFYTHLGLLDSNNTSSSNKGSVHHGTFQQHAERFIEEKSGNVRENLTVVLSGKGSPQPLPVQASGHPVRKRVMIFDELDTILTVLEQKHHLEKVLKTNAVFALLQYLWKNRKTNNFNVRSSEQYQQCTEAFKQVPQLLDYLIADTMAVFKDYDSSKYPKYEINEGCIGYVDAQLAVSFDATYGAATVAAYFDENEKDKGKVSDEMLQRQVGFSISMGGVSYLNVLTDETAFTVGATATIPDKTEKSMRQALSKHYGIPNLYSMPSSFGNRDKRFKFNHIIDLRIIADNDFYSQLAAEANRKAALNNRAVLVILPDDKAVLTFSSKADMTKHGHKLAVLTHVSAQNPAYYQTVIKTSAVAGKITVIPLALARGPDFWNSNKIEMHLIYAAAPATLAEKDQGFGRVARMGASATAELMVSRQNAKEVWGLTDAEVNHLMLNPQNIYAKMIGQFLKLSQSKLEQQEKNLEETKKEHAEFVKFAENLRISPTSTIVSSHLLKCNCSSVVPVANKDVRIAVMLDATGSMGKVIDAVKNVLGKTLEELMETFKTEKDYANTKLSVNIIWYKNYNAKDVTDQSGYVNDKQLITNFLSKVKANGGLGREAVEIAFSHVTGENYFPADVVFLIGDAAPNTREDTNNNIRRRLYECKINDAYQNEYNRIYFEDQLTLMKEKKIPVYTIYLETAGSDLAEVRGQFNRISNATGGQASFIDFAATAVKPPTEALNTIFTEALIKVVAKGDSVRLLSVHAKRLLVLSYSASSSTSSLISPLMNNKAVSNSNNNAVSSSGVINSNSGITKTPSNQKV